MHGDSALWRFATRFYREPGVAEACLRLQDEAGVDVNVMLYLLFLAGRGFRVRPQDMQRIEEVASAWRDHVVAPLRQIRRKLKSPIGVFDPLVTGKLRDDVKRIELAAEHIQLDKLEALLASNSSEVDPLDRIDCARANLATYAGTRQPMWDEPLRVILQAFARYRDATDG